MPKDCVSQGRLTPEVRSNADDQDDSRIYFTCSTAGGFQVPSVTCFFGNASRSANLNAAALGVGQLLLSLSGNARENSLWM